MKLTEKRSSAGSNFHDGKQKRNDWQKQLGRHPKNAGTVGKIARRLGKGAPGVNLIARRFLADVYPVGILRLSDPHRKAPKKYTLTDTLLETLSIIAYKQPVTRLDVEKIRGVNCDHAINRLVEYKSGRRAGTAGCARTPAFIRHDRTVFTVVWRRLSGRAAGAVCRTGRRRIQTSRQSRRRCCSCRRDSHITDVLRHIMEEIRKGE